MTARAIVSKIRSRILDRAAHWLQDSDILEAVDDALQDVYIDTRLSLRDHELDNQLVPVASFTELASNVFAYKLPEHMAVPRFLFVMRGAEKLEIPLDRSEIEHKEIGRINRRFMSWHWAKGRMPGSIEIRGPLGGYENVRVHYIRRWPPMHFGTAATSGLNTLVLPASGTGRIVARDSVYDSIDIEITGGSPTAIDSINRVASYVGSTRTCTMEANWDLAPTTSTQYSLVIPVEPEHIEYLVAHTVYLLHETGGNHKQLAALAAREARLHERMLSSLRARDTSRPLRVQNYRSF